MTAVNDVIVRSVPAPEPTSPGKKTKTRALARVGAGLAVLAVSATTLLTGFAVTPTGTTPGTVAMAEEGDGPIDRFFGGIVDTFNPCQNPSRTDLPGIREYSGDVTDLGPSSANYTAYEWYGAAATNSWENYTWDEVGGGCYLTLQGFNVIPNLMLSLQNNISTGVVIPSIGWISGVNLIDVFFLDPESSVVPKLVENLNRVFYSEYLIVIIALSAVSLIWVGLVKRRYRESITDMIWIVAAAAAGMVFLSNPTIIAGWMDKGVYAVQNTIISSATQAGTFEAESRCKPDDAVTDYPVSSQVRTMQCSLWDAFVFQPWAQGQMGKAATEGIEVDGTTATFKDSSNAAMVLLDVRTYNRQEVADGDTTGAQKAEIDERKAEQWAALGETIIDDPSAQVGHPYWTGEAWIERMTIAAGQLAAKLFAFIPLLVLSFGMLSQQIVFVLLMLVAPFFLLAGIFPTARRFALGWLEMVLATGVKRVIYAAFIGLLFMWFAAVSSTDIPPDSMGVLGAIVGVNFQVLLMAIGAVVVLIVQRKVIKKAGDAINLGGERITDGGKTREFITMTGGAVAAGLGSKTSGGSFSDGFGENFDNPVTKNPAVRRFNNERRKQVIASDREQGGTRTSALENADLTSDSDAAPISPSPAPRPATPSRRPGHNPAAQGSPSEATSPVPAQPSTPAANTSTTTSPAGTSSPTPASAPRPARRGTSASVGDRSLADALDSELSSESDTTTSGGTAQAPHRPRAADRLRQASESNNTSDDIADSQTSAPNQDPESSSEDTSVGPTRPTPTEEPTQQMDVDFALAAKESPADAPTPSKNASRPARPTKRDN